MIIEFIGPGGAGKSSIREALLRQPQMYGDLYSIKKRALFDYSNRWQHVPHVMRSQMSRLIPFHYLKHQFFNQFVADNPGLMSVIMDVINQTDNDKEGLWDTFYNSISKYEMITKTSKNKEISCLDESFLHKAVSVAFRNKDYSLPESSYFNSIPLPDLLIHIDAPAKVCVERQQKRGQNMQIPTWREEISKVEIEKRIRSVIKDVVKKAKDRGVNIIYVDNITKIEVATEKILSYLGSKESVNS